MSFDPLLPAWAILLAVITAAATLAAAYRRPCVPAGLRAAACTVLLVMLANPVLRTPLLAPDPGHVTIVVDASGSMGLADHGGQVRLDAATALAGELGKVLRLRGAVEELALQDSALGAPRTIAAGDTDFAALALLAEGRERPQAVFLLSDGADWRGSDPEAALARVGVPVFTLGFGSAVPASNAAVQLSAGAASVAPGAQVPLTVTVSATPDLVGRQARLLVESDDGTPLIVENLALAPLTVRRLLPQAPATPGCLLWRARLDIAGGQASDEDDRAWCAVQVVDERIDLLAIEGRPGWDTTFALRAWRRDRRYEVASLHAMGRHRRTAGTVPELPLTATSLKGVDLLVLGSGTGAVLGNESLKHLAAFVDRGGGLLLLGPGPRDLPGIDTLDPLIFGTGAPEELVLTPELCALPGMLPTEARVGVQATPVAGLRPHSRVLVGSREHPLVALHRMGAGWVCSAAFSGLWRWQMRPDGGDAARAAGGADAGERLWRQVLQACVGSPRGPLMAERSEVAVGEEVVAWLDPDRDPLLPVEVLHPDGTRQPVQPQGDRVAVRADRPGLWQVLRGSDRAAVVALTRSREILAPARDDARLARLARATGGTACTTPEALLAEARRLAAAPALEPAGERVEPLVTTVWWFLLALGLLAAEWWIRRRSLDIV